MRRCAPATKTALAASALYGPGKQLELLGNQLSKACGQEDQITGTCVSVTRPVTAGYPIVTDQVGKAEAAIYAGKDAKEALSAAALCHRPDLRRQRRIQASPTVLSGRRPYHAAGQTFQT